MPFADDSFEIYGCHISLSKIKGFRLGQIEYIMRPVFIERGRSRWAKGKIASFSQSANHVFQFDHMEYYAAIIGESKYKNAVQEAETQNIFEAIVKSTAEGINSVIESFSGNKFAKSTHFRVMNAAWRVFVRTLEEIPAVACSEDGRRSEVYKNDELHSLLDQSIAPTIEMVPALYITTTEGDYVFFGNGIQVDNIELEYKRLKNAYKSMRDLHLQESKNRGFLQNILGIQIPPISIPFLSSEQKESTEVPRIEGTAADDSSQKQV